MKNPFRKLGAMFGKSRKVTLQTSSAATEADLPGPSAGGAGGTPERPEQLAAPSNAPSCVPIVVLPDEEVDGRSADTLETDDMNVCGLRTPKLLTPTVSPAHSDSSMQSDEESAAVAVQAVTATATSTNDCQELTALNTCGDLERELDAHCIPVSLRSEIDNIRNELLWQYPPFYDFCVIASDDDYSLSVQFRDYLSRTYRLIGCTLSDGFLTLGADLFDSYEVMMDHSYKAFFLVTETFSHNAFCRRVQSGAVFQCLMSKVKKDREKCVPVYPYGICRAPLALSGVAGLLPAQKEMMKRVLLNTYLPDIRKHRAMLDQTHYEQRCIEFKKRVNFCIEAYQAKNALEPSMPLLHAVNGLQNSVLSQGSVAEILPSNGNIFVSSEPSISDLSNQNSLISSTLGTSNQNSLVYSVPDKSDQTSVLESTRMHLSGSDEEIRKTLERLEGIGAVEARKSISGREENIRVNFNARNISQSVENKMCCKSQATHLDTDENRKLPEPTDNSIRNKNVKTEEPQEPSSGRTEQMKSGSHVNGSSDSSDESGDENEKAENEDDTSDDASKLPKKICEALKSTNIGNSPGTTVVNIDGSTGTVTVGPSITVVVNFAQNEKKRSPRRQSPRRPSSESD